MFASPGSGVWPLHGDEHQPPVNLLQRSVAIDQKRHCFPPNEERKKNALLFASIHGNGSAWLVTSAFARAVGELIRALRERWPCTKSTFRTYGVRNQRRKFSPYVVVASGLFNKPSVPLLPGIESFSGTGGVIHSLHYKDPASFRGKAGPGRRFAPI